MPSVRTSWPRTSSSSGRLGRSSSRCCRPARRARWRSSIPSRPGARADPSGARSAPACSAHHLHHTRGAPAPKESKPMRRPCAKTFRLVAMTAASAAVAACGLSSNNNTNALLAGPTGQPITVGISLPLAGPQHAGGFDTDGQACKKGYELWASDVNSHGGLLGRPVKLIILNDKGDPPTDAKNYETLITQDHVDLTLAPFSSLLTGQAAAKVTAEHHYVLA